MDEILEDFKKESKEIIDSLLDILEKIEEDFGQIKSLATFAQMVDRIMGGSKTIFEMTGHKLCTQVANYAELCKILGYRGAELTDKNIADVLVAFLHDATEMLDQMMINLGTEKEKDIKEILSKTFLDRLKWISERLSATPKSIGIGTDYQSEVDNLLKTLGVG